MFKVHNSKFFALLLAAALVTGCASKQGETDSAVVDPNAGPLGTEAGGTDAYGTGYGQEFDSSLQQQQAEQAGQAALLATTTFYFEFDSSSLRPDALVALDAHAADLIQSG